MGALVGLGLGIGLFCVWWSCWAPAPRPGGDQPGGDQSGAAAPVSWWAERQARWRDELVQAGVDGVGPGALATTCVVLGLTTGLAVAAMSNSPPISACFAVGASWLPVAGVRSRARQRRTRLRELWPEVVDNLSSGVRAGLSLPEALAQIGERGPEPLRPAFTAFARDYRSTGTFGEALDALKERLADPVADRICEALRITREVGGSDLGRLLRSLSAFLREDARTRAELLARQSWTVNAARLAVAAPWAVLAILATNPESVRPYNSATGVAVLATGAALSAVAYRVMHRIARLPDEARVLR